MADELAPEVKKTERWGSRVGVILAVAGSAVGLGNFLRFPGVASQHGGGAFMIPYFLALVLLGIPICWAEWSMGRYGGKKGLHSSPAILGVIGRGRWARYLGAIGILIPLVVFFYYSLIESWCLRYVWLYIKGGMDLGADAGQFVAHSGDVFSKVAASDANGLFRGESLSASGFWVAVFIMNMWLVYRGLTGGIGKFCEWAMPAMALCAVIVLARVLTLGSPPAAAGRSVADGLGFMWNPRWEYLAQPETWLAAAGQIFFSLSVGFGVIINYASYLRRKEDVALSGLTASATNELFEVGLGGMITIPAAFLFFGALVAGQSTFGLGFNTLPVVFEYMGPAGRFIGATWFFMLFLAAITSSISMLQPVKAFVEEALGVTKGASAVIVTAACAAGALWVLYFSKDLVGLDTMDFWAGSFFIVVLATVQVILFGWVFQLGRGGSIFGARRSMHEVNSYGLIRVPGLFGLIIKYVSPVFLLAVLTSFVVKDLGGKLTELGEKPVALATVIFILVILALIMVAIRVGESRWRAAGIDIDNEIDENDGALS